MEMNRMNTHVTPTQKYLEVRCNYWTPTLPNADIYPSRGEGAEPVRVSRRPNLKCLSKTGMSVSRLFPVLQVASTFCVFGLYYFVFGLFAVLGLVMLGIILLAEPDPQYDLSDLMNTEEDQRDEPSV